MGGVTLALGEQEAIQVVQAGQQLGTDLLVGSSLGTFSHSNVAELGDFADQMVFLWSFPPATADLPVYDGAAPGPGGVGRGGAAAREPQGQPDAVVDRPLRPALHDPRRRACTEFTREGITAMLNEAQDVPMLDMFGGEDWTPDADHPGVFQRAGTNHWATYEWDPEAPRRGSGLEGNFVQASEISFDEVLCGSLFGAPRSAEPPRDR